MQQDLKAKVLLVDDEKEFIKTLSERLEIRGLNVTAATRGADAIECANNENFDAIILDLAMPGMDGLETLTRIRAQHPNAEIIMLTGQASVKSSVEAMKLGAEDYLEKPVNLEELLNKISEAKEKRILILQKQSKDEIEAILKAKAW